MVKNLPVNEEIQETQVPALGMEGSYREKWQPTPVILPGKSMDRGTWGATVHGVEEADTTHQLSTRLEGSETGKQERDKAAAFTSLKAGSFIPGPGERRVTPEPRIWGQDCLLHFLLCILDKVISTLSQPQLPQFWTGLNNTHCTVIVRIIQKIQSYAFLDHQHYFSWVSALYTLRMRVEGILRPQKWLSAFTWTLTWVTASFRMSLKHWRDGCELSAHS